MNMSRHGWLLLLTVLSCDLVAGCRARPSRSQASLAPPASQTLFDDAVTPAIHRVSPAEESEGLITSASYQEPVELPPPAAEELPPATDALSLDEVLLSVERSYPVVAQAMIEQRIADGKRLSARGEFDTRLEGFSMSEAMGYYENYRNGMSLEQPLYRGGYLYGGYRIGDGDFEPWYKERQTNEGGEFALGMGAPLLKGRAIDDRRAAVMQADLARQAVDPAIQTQVLESSLMAAQVYWVWVAAGQAVQAQRELLTNAQTRVEQIVARVDEGDLKQITRINNEQLIASREAKAIESERKLQEAGIKLSLFYRDSAGQPIIPSEERLPKEFPEPVIPNSDMVEIDITTAIGSSPVLRELELQMQQVQVELRNAENSLLPKLDALVKASQDVGAASNIPDVKGPFELEAGFYGEVPLQRRAAQGKVVAAQAKLSQLNVKREFVRNKIRAAVLDAISAMTTSAERIARTESNVSLARETLQLAGLQFQEGDIDLIELNIYEQAATEAELLLIGARADYFIALADYRAALALDPVLAW